MRVRFNNSEISKIIDVYTWLELATARLIIRFFVVTKVAELKTSEFILFSIAKRY